MWGACWLLLPDQAIFLLDSPNPELSEIISFSAFQLSLLHACWKHSIYKIVYADIASSGIILFRPQTIAYAKKVCSCSLITIIPGVVNICLLLLFIIMICLLLWQSSNFMICCETWFWLAIYLLMSGWMQRIGLNRLLRFEPQPDS